MNPSSRWLLDAPPLRSWVGDGGDESTVGRTQGHSAWPGCRALPDRAGGAFGPAVVMGRSCGGPADRLLAASPLALIDGQPVPGAC